MLKFSSPQEALKAFAEDRALHEERGVTFPDAVSYIPETFRGRMDLAMDAQPALSTEANSAVPAMLTTTTSTGMYEILFSPNKAAEILGERRNGDWLMETAMFPTVEHTGEVSSYGDFNENGRAGANTNWPNRQAYLYQTMKEYGQRELERAGLARINWVSEIDRAAATIMKKYENFTYFFGVQGLQNYGLLNDPNLSASLSPAPKAAGGTAWVQNGVIVATPNEIYTDLQSLLLQLISQTNGLVNGDRLVLALSASEQVRPDRDQQLQRQCPDAVEGKPAQHPHRGCGPVRRAFSDQPPGCRGRQSGAADRGRGGRPADRLLRLQRKDARLQDHRRHVQL